MSELAQASALTPSGLTRAIDRLAERGLVSREACSEDRRGSFACLTDKGREQSAKAISDHRRRVEGLLGGELSADERTTLVLLLVRLRETVAPASG